MGPESDRPQPWREHLAELRRRLIWSLVVLLGMTVAALALAPVFFRWLRPPGIEWYAFSPMDTLATFLKVSLAFGFFLSLPFVLYQIWAFVRPGLTEREARAALKLIPASFALFLVGVALGYAVLFPALVRALMRLNAFLGLELVLGVRPYLELLVRVLLAAGAVFELPLVMIFLASVGLLPPERLKKSRPTAYFVLIVASWLFAPGDWVSFLLLVLPLLVLFELSALLIRLAFRRRVASGVG
ncbi:twin-arginine translocase subunit TatC [Hydrogenibacillus sp. N12]|uniref:twin-arginine translocase subunit TatC n=1 Tax=Hydrogenibacillus sp. N12 TaxID=2866627 RepID=UPI001C7D8913|nr:twin-arginine translocase subunit TatC [Hydrogenibacillus sp. N12]QZA33906.1 twin-arginine translocase subunit TatC [Hydrogenibacillus sp. N12]